MVWLAIVLSAVAAGVVQTVTGFGSGVVMIMIFSQLFEMTTAASLNTSICAALSISLAWKFRKDIQWKIVIPPAIPYLTMSVLTIRTISSMDMTVLAVIFGCFLIFLSVYFLFFESRVHLTGSYPTAIACGAVSGIFSGLFGVGGPLMALYFLSITKRRADYVATLQFFFVLSNAVALSTRFLEGLYSLDLLPSTLIGVLGIVSGQWLGLRIAERLDGGKLKKIIYIFVGISGAITLIQQIL